MLRILFFSVLITLSITSLPAKDKLTSHIENYQEAAKLAGSLDNANNCLIPLEFSYSPEKSSVYSALNKKNIELSVLSEKRAQEVFNKLKADEENSFEYPLDGCYARAHRMAMQMDQMGIVSGKTFIEGDNIVIDTTIGEIQWSYHVASLVMIKVGNKLIPSVFDPALFDKPVSYTEWKARVLKRPESKFVSEYFTKRFNMDPDTRYDDRDDYAEEEVRDALKDIQEYKKIYQNLKTNHPEDYQ